MGPLKSIRTAVQRLLSPESRFSHWERSLDLDYLLDLDANAVCGISLGADENALSILGPPYAEGGGLYSYTGDGLTFVAWEGKISTISISFAVDDEIPEAQPFSGRVAFRGQIIKLSEQTTRAEIIELFGVPNKQYDDDEGTGVVYYRGSTDLHFKFGPDETFLYIAINDIGEEADENEKNG
jgi:hypothetical protein